MWQSANASGDGRWFSGRKREAKRDSKSSATSLVDLEVGGAMSEEADPLVRIEAPRVGGGGGSSGFEWPLDAATLDGGGGAGLALCGGGGGALSGGAGGTEVGGLARAGGGGGGAVGGRLDWPLGLWAPFDLGTAGSGPRGAPPGLSALRGSVAKRLGGGGGGDALFEMSVALRLKAGSSSGMPGAICFNERRLCARATFGLALGGGGGGGGVVCVVCTLWILWILCKLSTLLLFVRLATLGDFGGGDGFFAGVGVASGAGGGFGARFGFLLDVNRPAALSVASFPW